MQCRRGAARRHCILCSRQTEKACRKSKQAYYNLKGSSQKQRLWELKGVISELVAHRRQICFRFVERDCVLHFRRARACKTPLLFAIFELYGADIAFWCSSAVLWGGIAVHAPSLENGILTFNIATSFAFDDDPLKL